MWQMLLAALVRYLQANPAAVDELVQQLVQAILTALKEQNAQTAGKS